MYRSEIQTVGFLIILGATKTTICYIATKDYLFVLAFLCIMVSQDKTLFLGNLNSL